MKRTMGLVCLCVLAACGGDGTPTGSGDMASDMLTNNSGSDMAMSSGAKRVFVTSQAYNGNLGGFTGADAKCNLLAQAANVTGTWKAWLSASTSSALDRIAGNGPWKSIAHLDEFSGLVQETIFNNRAGLMVVPLTNIHYDELGYDVTGNGQLSAPVWTGTVLGGTISTGGTCQNWTSSTCSFGSDCDYGETGSANAIQQWTDYENPTQCGEMLRIYCFEQ